MADPVTVTSSILISDSKEPLEVSACIWCIPWSPFSQSSISAVSPLEPADWCIHLSCTADLFFCCNPPTRPPNLPGSFPCPHSPSIQGEKRQQVHFTIHSACWAAKPAQHYEQQVLSFIIIPPSLLSFFHSVLHFQHFPFASMSGRISEKRISKRSAPYSCSQCASIFFHVLSTSIWDSFPH